MVVEVNMASAKGKVVVSAEVPRDFRDELDGRADAERRTRAKLIVRALRFYLAHAPVLPAQDDEVPPPKREKK
jgi:hypothetical protein